MRFLASHLIYSSIDMVVVQLIGGLGNQMFQYACGMNLARLNGTKLLVDTSFIENRMPVNQDFVYRDYELDIFSISTRISDGTDFPRYPKNWRINNRLGRIIHLLQVLLKGYKYVFEVKNREYDHLLFRPSILKKRGNLYLVGYWVSEKYFKNIESVVRQEFKFKNLIIDESAQLLEEIEASNSVCLHVRRTDLLNVKEMGFHGVNYYERALEKLSSSVKDL